MHFDDFLEDTESCFGPEIFILNLGCSIVMTLQEQERGQGQERSHDGDSGPDPDPYHSDGDSGVADVTKSKGGKRKKYLWLPARSLLVLRGAARYSWSHGIAPRTTDKVHTHTL
jgi:alkylated DNA repair protein alkB homolog 8